VKSNTGGSLGLIYLQEPSPIILQTESLLLNKEVR